MTRIPQEGLRIAPKELTLGQRFVIFDPSVAHNIISLTGYSAEHVLSARGTSLLFRFNMQEGFMYDFRSTSYQSPISLYAFSVLNVGVKPTERLRRWSRDLHLGIFLPGNPDPLEEQVTFQRETKRLEVELNGLEEHIENDFHHISQVEGQFVKHPPLLRA